MEDDFDIFIVLFIQSCSVLWLYGAVATKHRGILDEESNQKEILVILTWNLVIIN